MKQFGFIFIFLYSYLGHAQNLQDFTFSKPQEPLKVIALSLGKENIQAGDRLPVTIKISLDEPYHAYEDKIAIKALQPSNTDLSELIISPLVGFLDNAGQEHIGIYKEATIKFFIEAKEATEYVEFVLDYIACTQKICLPKKEVIFGRGTNPNSDLSFSYPNKNGTMGFSIENYLDNNLALAFFFIFIFGFLTSLTPCVYPLIPITLAVIGTQAANSRRSRAFFLSLIYVLGIGVTYSVLGVFAAKTGALFGQALSYPPVVIAFSFMFLALAFAMFGYYEIRAPHFLTRKLVGHQTSAGYIGAFLSGLIAGIIASPCVGPVLVGVLAYIAKTQNALLGFSLLFTFAMGMGILFLALGTFSSLAKKIPKSGGWMDFVKYILGLTLIGLCYFYLSPLLSAKNDMLLAAFLILLSGLVFFKGFYKNARNLALVVLFICMSYAGYIGSAGLLVTSSQKIAAEKYINGWQPYAKEKITEAKTKGIPVIIDFYADWCVACTELDELTFIDPRIIELSKKFMLLKVDETESFEGMNELNDRYKVFGLPTIIFIGADGETRDDLTLTGFEKADRFLKRMNSAL